ncbi:MAG: methyltransferase domain-containing protein [Halioglobus sp.]|nr:methyltransferase domain-containing protein [Halioglobus sp.]
MSKPLVVNGKLLPRICALARSLLRFIHDAVFQKAILKRRIEELESEFSLYAPLIDAAKKSTSHLEDQSQAHINEVERILVCGIPSSRDDNVSPDYAKEFNWQRYIRDQYNTDTLKVLEIGARDVTQSGRQFEGICSAENYTGFDVEPGENVDVVGDAHRLSEFFEAEYFDVVYSAAVLEHIAMPWVLAEEISKILKVGGTIITATHFAFSEHELPWHFFQFNKGGLRSLFCSDLGFEEIQCEHYLPMVGRFAEGCDTSLRGKTVGHLYCSTHSMCKKTHNAVDLNAGRGFNWRGALDGVYAGTSYPKN